MKYTKLVKILVKELLGYDKQFYMDPLQFGNNSLKSKILKTHWSYLKENLWIGDIDIAYLSLSSAERFSLFLDDYIAKEGYNFDIKTIDVDKGTVPHVEQVAKAVYLTKQYLKTNSFRDPICSHYNPRLDKNFVHPGGTRQVILDLFHKGPVRTFYFNTNGHKFEFLKQMKVIEIEDFYTNYHPVFHLDVVPDHGTLIPHVLKIVGGVGKLPEVMTTQHIVNKKKLSSDYKIFVHDNIQLKYFNEWQTSTEDNADVVVKFKTLLHDDADVVVKFKTRTSLDNHIKATLLILSGDNYTDTDLEVTHQ